MRIRAFILLFISASLAAAEGKAQYLTRGKASGLVETDSVIASRSYHADPVVDSSLPPTDGILDASLFKDVDAGLRATVSLEWYRSIFGTGVGDAGMVVADIDADGDLELAATARDFGYPLKNFWYVLEWDGQDYVHRWASLPTSKRIDRLLVAQLDQDSALEVVLFVGGSILAYDGATFDLEMARSVSPNTPRVTDMALANVDDDPAVEAIVCNEDGTRVYELPRGCQQFFRAEYPCSGVAVGEIDGTPGVEIVLANRDGPGFVLDGASGDLEWTHVLGFGDFVEVGDIDGDSLDEIVAGFPGSGISVWNGDTQGFAWEVSVFRLATIKIADVEDDGPLEVVYGDASWGAVHVLEGQSGVRKYSIDHPGSGTTRIAVADADRDGLREILFGTTDGYPGHGLYAADIVDRKLEWESADIFGPFYGLAHGDVDDDGDTELVYTTFVSDSGYGDGLYFVHDAATKQLEFRSPEPTRVNWTGLWSVQVADVQGDRALEIFLPTSLTRDGVLQCIDGATHELWWQTELDDSTSFASLQLADLEGDGSLEVVSGVEVHSADPEGVYVFAHDAASGELTWKSPNLESFFGGAASLTLLRVADIDGDGTGEILVAEPGKGLLALDPVDESVDFLVSEASVTALEVDDLDGDGVPDIVIGTDRGFLRRVNAETGDTIALAGPYPAPVDAVAIADITDDAVADFIICTADRVHLIDGATGKLLWVSVDLGSEVGRHDSLVVGDLDLDGRIEIWVNAGRIGHFMFEVVEVYEKKPMRWRRTPGARRILPDGERPECPPG